MKGVSQRCATCANARKANDPAAIGRVMLACHANPPLPLAVAQGGRVAVMTVFPTVQPDQWCGHWANNPGDVGLMGGNDAANG